MIDYLIIPQSRDDARVMANFFRIVFRLSKIGAIDPVRLLDKLPDIEGFSNVQYEIVEDETLSSQVPARCLLQEDGYLIQIKESVYYGAYKRQVGGFRMHIMHEIVHVFVNKIGFKQIYARNVAEKCPAYCSLEWFVKAIAGEIMMPYDETKGLSKEEIMKCYGVSESAANMRLKY